MSTSDNKAILSSDRILMTARRWSLLVLTLSLRSTFGQLRALFNLAKLQPAETRVQPQPASFEEGFVIQYVLLLSNGVSRLIVGQGKMRDELWGRVMGLLALGAAALVGSAGVVRGSVPPLRSPSLARGIQMLPGASGRVRKRLEPGTLILVRNGLPAWGLPDEQFIGWADPDLSEEGQMQVRSAARLLVESGHTVDTVHTSMMKRSIRTVWIILHELERIYLPVTKDWRLAARRCGALTGLSTATIERHFGADYLARLKTDRDMRPPCSIDGLSASDYSATRERTFKHLSDDADILPSESLSEALARCEPAWKVRTGRCKAWAAVCVPRPQQRRGPALRCHGL